MNKNLTKRNSAFGNYLLAKYERKSKNYEKELKFLIEGHENYFDSMKKKFEPGIKYCFDDVLQIQKEVRVDEINTNNLNKESAACSVAAYKEITDKQINYKEILEKTSLLGRCDVKGKFILDVSHNLASVQNLVSFINKECKGKSIKAIVGLMQDKDFNVIIFKYLLFRFHFLFSYLYNIHHLS